jgi:hypothetical protein
MLLHLPVRRLKEFSELLHFILLSLLCLLCAPDYLSPA